MKPYTLVIALYCLCCRLPLGAQLPAYQAQIFGEEYGLGGGNIFNAFIDTKQFVWLTTPSNVQRFDGKNVKKFPFKDIISHAICDSEGHIWVLSGQSVWRNRAEKDDFLQIQFDTSGANYIRGIFQMRNSPLSLLCVNGIYEWNAGKQAFERRPIDIPKPGGRQNITRIDTCENTLLYPLAGGGVCALDLATGQARKVDYGFEFNQVFLLTPDLGILLAYGQETFWLDFKKGELRLIDAREYGLTRRSFKMAITGCTPLGAGRFLVTTKYGVCIYDLNVDRFERKQVYAEGRPITEEFVMNRIFLDPYGTAWAVTPISLLAMQTTEHSLGLLRNYHFDPVHQWDNRIWSMAEDDKGNIWLSGIFSFKKLNPKTAEVSVFPITEGDPRKLEHSNVRAIAWDGKRIILGPTNTGVWLFDPFTQQYSRPRWVNDTVRQSLGGDFIDYIGKMRNGDHLVCGRFFLYRIEPGTYRTSFIRFPGDKDNMNTVMQAADGKIWLGTTQGVICLDEQYRFLRSIPMPGVSPVSGMMEYNNKELLIAARNGLYRLNLDNDSYNLDKIPGLAEGFNVTGVFRDSLRRIWVCSHNGLYLADSTFNTVKRFDFADNIQSNLFSDGGMLRASNGMVYLSGQNGVNYFYPEKISISDQPLSVSIQAVDINDGDSVVFQPGDRMKLAYWQNTLRFELAAPYYNNAAKVQYRYRLNNHSPNWIYLGSANTFRLPKLPPGHYVLEISASISGRTWFDAATPFSFSISAPFWNTWWFYLLAVVAVLGAMALYILYRERRLQAWQTRQLEIEQLRNTALQYELETQQVIHYFSQSIGLESNVEDALWNVAQGCISRLGWEDCVIYLLDKERSVLLQKAAWGQKSTPDLKIVDPIEIPLGQGIVGAVAASGKPECVEDTGKDPRYIVDDSNRRSELAVPILLDGEAIGVIDTEHTQKGFYTPWHVQLLTAIAALCSNKIALARAEEAREEVRRQLEEKEKSLLEVEKRAAQVRLIALTNHLNPHFLFNSLTSLNSLIFENQQLASDFLQHLSKVYRYLLQHKDKETVSLKNEADFVQNYIFLLKTRFAEDIRFDLHFERNTLEKGIVPVTLQILIENAVKHNIIAPQSPLYIEVYAVGDMLAVRNNIQRKKQVETSNRQGLESLRALYRYLSDRPIEVLETDGFFTVKLPLIDT